MPKFRKETTPERVALAQKLKHAREEAKLAQKDAADALGIPASVLCNVESGNRRIDVSELAAMARLYGKPVSWFFDETTIPPDGKWKRP